MFMRLLSLLMAVGLIASVSACQTIAGAGKDIQSGGEMIEETAEDTQKKM